MSKTEIILSIMSELGTFFMDMVVSVGALLKPYWWCFILFGVWAFANFYYNLQKSRKERDAFYKKMHAEQKRHLQEEIDAIEL